MSMPVSASSHPDQSSRNRLLASLPPEEFERVSAHLSPYSLQMGNVLHEPGQKVEQVFFVEEGMLSYVLYPAVGLGVEVGVVGSEGVGGAGAVLAQQATSIQIMVQSRGTAQVMPAEAFSAEVRRGEALHQSVQRHLHEMSMMAARNALCNRQHTTEERLSRWLLMVNDRVPRSHLELKGSFLSLMLGSRESGVFIAASILKKSGLIDFDESSVTITNRKGLESAACDCYEPLRLNALQS